MSGSTTARWKAIVSDWQLVGSFRALTGPWLTITTGADVALNGQAGTQRANQVSDDVYANQAVNPTTSAISFLDPGRVCAAGERHARDHGAQHRSRTRQQEPRPGADPRVQVLERPGTSRSAIESFNAFNWFEWGQPNTAINAATFGQITSTSTTVPPRVMQLAVKYVF